MDNPFFQRSLPPPQIDSCHFENNLPQKKQKLFFFFCHFAAQWENTGWWLHPHITRCQTRSGSLEPTGPADHWRSESLTRMMGQIELGGRMWSFRGPQSHSGFTWEAHLLWSWRRWRRRRRSLLKKKSETVHVACVHFQDLCALHVSLPLFYICYELAATNKSVNWWNDSRRYQRC